MSAVLALPCFKTSRLEEETLIPDRDKEGYFKSHRCVLAGTFGAIATTFSFNLTSYLITNLGPCNKAATFVLNGSALVINVIGYRFLIQALHREETLPAKILIGTIYGITTFTAIVSLVYSARICVEHI